VQYQGQPSDEPFLSFLCYHLDALAPGKSLLDCACGTGEPGLSLAESFSVTFTDKSREMLRVARAKAALRGLCELPFFCVGWTDLPSFLSTRFDVVVCAGNALGQLRTSRQRLDALRAIVAMLAPSGVLYVDYDDWHCSKVRHLKLTHISGPHRVNDTSLIIPCFRRKSPNLIQRLKIALSLESPSSKPLATGRSFSARISEAEMRSSLAAVGCDVITVLPRPGRWRLTAILARRS
jgi:SAM-dependent methyltransferase